mmetsp:Transcript_29821/g.77191  ORF Transcript_29821/g.77191 Transcript_29821/m.77191 type:complete len:213 (+) Transcript_29821:575-1213(+)
MTSRGRSRASRFHHEPSLRAARRVFEGVRPPMALKPGRWPTGPQSMVAGAEAAYSKPPCLDPVAVTSSIDVPPSSSSSSSSLSLTPASGPAALDNNELACGDGSGMSNSGSCARAPPGRGRTRGLGGTLPKAESFPSTGSDCDIMAPCCMTMPLGPEMWRPPSPRSEGCGIGGGGGGGAASPAATFLSYAANAAPNISSCCARPERALLSPR